MNIDSAKKKLEDGYLILDKAGNDLDLLGLALTKIHAALEEASRIWLSEPTVAQDHQLKANDRQQVSWKEILELMSRYYQWSPEDVNYVRGKNQLRNQIAHGDEFNLTRQEVEEYASYIGVLLERNQLPVRESNRNTSSAQVNSASQQHPQNIVMPPARSGQKNIAIAYGLWALGFCGLFGIHRFYLERPVTGFLWLFSGGVFFIGQIIDLFLIPSMVNGTSPPALPANNQLLDKSQQIFDKLDRLDSKLQTTIFQQVTQTTLKKTSAMNQLLEVAIANGKVLSIGQAVRETGLPPEEVQKLLDEAMRRGIANIGNDPQTGAIRYYFDI